MSLVQTIPLLMCASWEEYSVKVPGSKGDIYTVSHGYAPPSHPYQFRYSCDCKGFQFHGTCKHVKKVEQENPACLWHQQFDGGDIVNGKCPKCGGEAREVLCAV